MAAAGRLAFSPVTNKSLMVNVPNVSVIKKGQSNLSHYYFYAHSEQIFIFYLKNFLQEVEASHVLLRFHSKASGVHHIVIKHFFVSNYMLRW